ncbi:MAG TPA: hypothetical protein VGU02_10755, partial [Gaiellaceae bacterium]|nr:hypothetical protein [Gaiellaceae bacterium]
MLRFVPIIAALLLHAAAGPVVTVSPTITGQLQQGKQLTVSAGTWTGVGTVAYAYQWYRCDSAGAHCGSIHGATRASYTEVAKDVGGTLSAAVAATDSTGRTRVYAPLAGIVAPKAATFAPTSQPSIAGAPIVGEVVSVVAPVKSPAPTYAWLHCNANERLCMPIANAESPTYTVA